MADTNTSAAATDWAQLYNSSFLPQHQFSASTPSMFGQVSDSTVVTVASNPAQTERVVGGSPGNEGRVRKSSRRRSRASRKAPTTLLNTDTANFRAMVQQFTGIPTGTFSSGYQTARRPVFMNYAPDFNEQLRRQSTEVLQQRYRHHQQPHQDGSCFLLGNNTVDHAGFVDNPMDDEFFVDGVSGQLIPRSATNGNNGGTGGYFS